MSEKKPWLVLGAQPNETYFQALQAALNDSGCVAKMEIQKVTEADFAQVFDKARAAASSIRLTDQAGEWAVASVEALPAETAVLRTADAMQLHGGRWWPRCYLVEGIRIVIAQDLHEIDFSGEAFVVGDGPRVRAVVSELIRIGFKKVTLTCNSADQGTRLLNDFRRAYFGVEFAFVPSDQITELPGVNTIAVNTVMVAEAPELTQQLYYFNFLRRGGIWLDLSLTPSDHPLLVEARTVGARVQTGDKVLAYAETAWAKACMECTLDTEKFAASVANLFHSPTVGA